MKTDYQARRTLATSGAPRFVVRPSNKGIIVQLVNAEIIGDRVVTQTSTKELTNYGWQASGKSIQAGYLLGYIAGKKALKEGVETAYLDLGLKRPTKGNKVFAVVKGAVDAGLNVPCDSDIMPSPERISGEDLAKYAKEMTDPAAYEKQFSAYLRNGLRPEAMPEYFEAVKKKIQEELA